MDDLSTTGHVAVAEPTGARHPRSAEARRLPPASPRLQRNGGASERWHRRRLQDGRAGSAAAVVRVRDPPSAPRSTQRAREPTVKTPSPRLHPQPHAPCTDGVIAVAEDHFSSQAVTSSYFDPIHRSSVKPGRKCTPMSAALPRARLRIRLRITAVVAVRADAAGPRSA